MQLNDSVYRPGGRFNYYSANLYSIQGGCFFIPLILSLVLYYFFQMAHRQELQCLKSESEPEGVLHVSAHHYARFLPPWWTHDESLPFKLGPLNGTHGGDSQPETEAAKPTCEPVSKDKCLALYTKILAYLLHSNS